MASILAASQHVRRATGLCASTSGSRFVGVLASSVRRGIICSERRVAGAADSKDAGMASNGQQGGRGGSGKQRQGGEKVQLDESDALFQPWLTERDPKGHKSGYVAIVGKPNAGKSTLMNCLLGQKLSIVTNKVQTTRHKILGVLSDTMYQIVMLDTPGVITRANSRMEERMMAAVKGALSDADAVLAIIDATDKPLDALAMLEPGSGWEGPPLCLALNKCDNLDSQSVDSLLQEIRASSRAANVLPISAKTGAAIDQLKDWMVSVMPEGPTLYNKDYIAQAPERFFVSEIIREKIFELYREEVPYCCQVNVVEFKERKTGKDYIRAEILVERKGHVGIIMGRAGSAVKQLSSASRVDIEGFLGRPVYLELTVKHSKGWRDDDGMLSQFGY